jgi:hypothetical protein
MKEIVVQGNVYQICQGLGQLKPGVLVILLSAIALLVGQVAAQGASDQRPRVLTTVAPLTNIVKNVGGPYIELRDDDLPGTPGSPQHSYMGMLLENVRTMVTALGGRADALQRIDPADLP